jgi:hypothetical protein
MAFSCPTMCKVASGDTCFVFIRRVSAQRSYPATNEPFAANRLTQLTVGK